MVYKLINQAGCFRTREEFVNHECFYIIIQKTRDFSMGLPAQARALIGYDIKSLIFVVSWLAYLESIAFDICHLLLGTKTTAYPGFSGKTNYKMAIGYDWLKSPFGMQTKRSSQIL